MFKFAVHIKYYDNDSNFKGRHFFRTAESKNVDDAKMKVISELKNEYAEKQYNIKSIKLTAVK